MHTPAHKFLLTIFIFIALCNLRAQQHMGVSDSTYVLTPFDNKESIITQKWRFSISGGMGYRLSSTKQSKNSLLEAGFELDVVNNYFRQVKWGYKMSGQIHRIISENYGLGIDYQFHHSSGTLSGYIDPGDNVSLYYTQVDDDIYTNYLGLSFYAEDWISSERLKWYSQASLGLTMFRQESVSGYYPSLITGKALGTNLELGLEYFLNSKLSVGLKTNFFQSTLHEVTAGDGHSSQKVKLPDEKKEGLSRIDLSLGIQIYL